MVGHSRRLQRMLGRLPWAGHPVLETLLERAARKNAFRAGYLLAQVVRALAPQVDLRPMAEAFDEGLASAEQVPSKEGTVYRFPGR